MNKTITARFKSYQNLLIEVAIVSHFTIVRQHITESDGNIRIRAALTDGSLLEMTEYVALDDKRQITARSYSFHWQDTQHQLIQRWDNANHYPELSFAPHHIHKADETVTGNPQPPMLDSVLDIIERQIA